MQNRELDVVMFGATGDTGVCGCCCLYFQGKKLGINKWAPAARNLKKLKTDVLDRFEGTSPGAEGVAPSESIKADSGDFDSLVSMCKRTKCVVACAGPFALYGEGVVKACAETGTHYVDVTGEVPWVQQMEQKYGAIAEKNGACIVSMAGYDSIPPDLTAYLAAKGIEKAGERIDRYEVFISGAGGAMPTGTLETVCNLVDDSKSAVHRALSCGMIGGPAPPAEKPAVKDEKAALTTYVPKEASSTVSSSILWSMLPGFSPLAKHFTFGHFMAPINTNVVYRTAVAEGYGNFTYRERLGGMSTGLTSLFGLLPTLSGCAILAFIGSCLPLPFSTTALRGIRDKYNPPLTKNVRDNLFNNWKSTGHTTAEGFARSVNGSTSARVHMHGKYDCGLGFTMLLACTTAGQIVKKEATSTKPRAGFQTAVRSVGGEFLAEGLRNAGVELTVTTSSTKM